jgi:hypothetical protein
MRPVFFLLSSDSSSLPSFYLTSNCMRRCADHHNAACKQVGLKDMKKAEREAKIQSILEQVKGKLNLVQLSPFAHPSSSSVLIRHNMMNELLLSRET